MMKLFIVASLLVVACVASVDQLPDGVLSRNAPDDHLGQCYGLSLPRSCARTTTGACDGHNNADAPVLVKATGEQCYVAGHTVNNGNQCPTPGADGLRQQGSSGPLGASDCCVTDVLQSYTASRSVCRPNAACFTWEDANDGQWYLDLGISPRNGEPCCVYCQDLSAAELSARNGNVVPNGPALPCCGTPAPTTQAPTPRPTTQAPTPRPTTQAPTPRPTTQAPTPNPTTPIPTPQPTTRSPTPEPTTQAPTPNPTTQRPTPRPTTPMPTPQPTTRSPTPGPTKAPTRAPQICAYCCQTYLFPEDRCDESVNAAANAGINAQNQAAQENYDAAVNAANDPSDPNFLCLCTGFTDANLIPDATSPIPRSLCCKIAGAGNNVGCQGLSCLAPVPIPQIECPTCTCITDTSQAGFPLFPEDRCIDSGHVCEETSEESGPRTRYPFTIQECTESVQYNIKVDTTWINGNTYIIRNEIHVEAGARLTIEPGTVVLFENYYRQKAGNFAGRVPVSALIIDSGASLWARDVEFRADHLTNDQVTGGLIILGTSAAYAHPYYSNVVSNTAVAAAPLARITKLVRVRFTGLGNQGLGLPAFSLFGVGAADGVFQDIFVKDSHGTGIAIIDSNVEIWGASSTRGECQARNTSPAIRLRRANVIFHETAQVIAPKVAPGNAIFHEDSTAQFAPNTVFTVRTDSAFNTPFPIGANVLTDAPAYISVIAQ